MTAVDRGLVGPPVPAIPETETAAYVRGRDRAVARMERAQATGPYGGRECTAKRCRREATDLSGLCRRHLKLAADAARGGRPRPVFDPPTRPEATT